MNIMTLIDEIKRAGNEYSHDLIQKIMYVSDKDKNTCQDCIKNDGKIFNIDDPELPQLPIHPHCCCKYVSAADPDKDISEYVEHYRIVKNLKEICGVENEKADSFAKQIINARHENLKIREQKLFLLFNGRYLISSDGKMILDAVSGQTVSEQTYINKVTPLGMVYKTVEREFDYSYSRQGIKDKGGIPRGLYYILAHEERSSDTSPWSHGVRSNPWGKYSWSLHPDQDTDVRERSGFFIHGGSDFNTKGCIDLQRGDGKFQEYFVSTKRSYIYVYVNYEKERIKIQEKKEEISYPITTW